MNADGSDNDDSNSGNDKPKEKKLSGKRKRGKTLLYSINNVEETESEEVKEKGDPDADDESDTSLQPQRKFEGNFIRNMGTSSLATGDATGKLFYV